MHNALKWGLAASLVALSMGAAAAKDTVVIGHTLEPPGLDPTAGAAAPIRYITYANLYEGLARVMEDGSVQPLLAESWTVSDDQKTYTFKLRQGVKFHDGSPFDCSTVKFSYERAVAPDSTNAQKGLFEPIEKTECPDPATAVVTLTRPASNFLFNMAWGDAVMVSPDSVAEGTYSGFGAPIGSHYTPIEPGYVDLNDAYPYDPAKAKELLQAAGVPDGFEMTIKLPPPTYARRGGEIIAAMLAEVGIRANLVPLEFPQWLEQIFRGSDFDATIINHAEARDLDIYARDKYYFNYQNPEYKALYKAFTEASTEAEQMDLVGQLQRKLSADEPNVFLYAFPKIGVWNNKLKGLWVDMPVPADDVTQAHWED